MTQQRQRRRWNGLPEWGPLQTILLFFVIWKTLILLIATLSPGPGYDTSTLLLLGRGDDDRPNPPPGTGGERAQEWLPCSSFCWPEKLVRWDAIYFAKIAERGYLFEQEWAFGWGLTRLITLLSRGIARTGIATSKGGAGPLIEINVGIAISHVAHLFSVVVLYHLTKLMFAGEKGKKLALIASILHTITPAGIFLSAPYAESLFALLNFAGHFIYTASLTPNGRGRSWENDLCLVLSGAVFGLATTVRSNGLLNGILYLYDLTGEIRSLPRDGVGVANARKAAALGVAGILVGLGTATPQWIAYLAYCGDENDRPWCKQAVPSIYAWVQDHYWNVGFMRYWTFSNLPLFLLAGPALLIMGLSAAWALYGPKNRLLTRVTGQGTPSATDAIRDVNFTRDQLQKFAIPQLVLAVLALTTYHVQIITRISSGYMVWYWWLAFLVSEEQHVEIFRRKWNLSRIVTRWMMVYAVVQGGLFASFLPPA
ncbi:hypothetical protein GP486_003871 [Trichoglossum hirsutum]|uniref:GPI mannosyltransferase 2 n=1 Tax=Trichoglossum hirsutum TaxID=265104 RepID=A0A9P8LBV2_9PEZI|nr:hypothetical protein GP486_003871 [Trichoglossum hirsutum]